MTSTEFSTLTDSQKEEIFRLNKLFIIDELRNQNTQFKNCERTFIEKVEKIGFEKFEFSYDKDLIICPCNQSEKVQLNCLIDTIAGEVEYCNLVNKIKPLLESKKTGGDLSFVTMFKQNGLEFKFKQDLNKTLEEKEFDQDYFFEILEKEFQKTEFQKDIKRLKLERAFKTNQSVEKIIRLRARVLNYLSKELSPLNEMITSKFEKAVLDFQNELKRLNISSLAKEWMEEKLSDGKEYKLQNNGRIFYK